MLDKKDIPRETNPCNCLVVGSLWADPLANVKQLVDSFIVVLLVRILTKETGRFETGRFDAKSSSEIAQKF